MNADKEKQAIQCLRAFEQQDEPYTVCYSGGKDSDTVRILTELAGVNHQCKHNLTTVDAPETVYYVRDVIGVENIERPPLTMWQLIIKKCIPPTRLIRYCCSELKKRNSRGKVKITGVRKSESRSRNANQSFVTIEGAPKHTQRAADEIGANYLVNSKGGVMLGEITEENRRLIGTVYKKTDISVNPIVDWSENDVWEFLHHYGCEGNPLYKSGFGRIGCVGCPLGGRKNMEREFELYPKYYENYIKTFDRMIDERVRRGMGVPDKWSSGEAVMKWWLN